MSEKGFPRFLVLFVEPPHLFRTKLRDHLIVAMSGAVGPRPLPPVEQRTSVVPIIVAVLQRAAVEVGCRGTQVQQQPALCAVVSGV